MVQIVTHGTLDYAELAQQGLSRADLSIFSSNVNPFGPPDAVLDAVAQAVTGPNLAHYPDRLSAELRALLADYHDVEPEAVVVGNGTADMIWLLALLYLKDVEPGRVVVLSPTFGEYENVASMVDTDIRPIALPGWTRTEQATYHPADRALDECLAELRAAEPEVVFLCNPNNPTGELFSRADVSAFLQTAPAALWIIDEAYMEFVPQPWSASEFIHEFRVIVLRSMTKDFALGGVRLGYLVAETEMAQASQTAQPPWNVNALAQAAGMAAMECLEWRTEAMARLREETERLRAEFRKVGLEPRPTTVNYTLTSIADPGDLRAYLLKDGLVIRDCTSFGLVDFFRVATQKPAENQKLVASLGRYLRERQVAD